MNFCTSLYNRLVDFTKNIVVATIDIYSHIELFVRKLYLQIHVKGSVTSLCSEMNNIVMITHEDDTISYKNILDDMNKDDLLKLLQDFINKESIYKLIYIENVIENNECRIFINSTIKLDIDYLLDPQIFHDTKIDMPFMNINIKDGKRDILIENVNLKSPINYCFKNNELLSSEFIQHFIDSTIVMKINPMKLKYWIIIAHLQISHIYKVLC